MHTRYPHHPRGAPPYGQVFLLTACLTQEDLSAIWQRQVVVTRASRDKNKLMSERTELGMGARRSSIPPNKGSNAAGFMPAVLNDAFPCEKTMRFGSESMDVPRVLRLEATRPGAPCRCVAVWGEIHRRGTRTSVHTGQLSRETQFTQDASRVGQHLSLFLQALCCHSERFSAEIGVTHRQT